MLPKSTFFGVQIQSYPPPDFPTSFMKETYRVLLLKGEGTFSVDQISYAYHGCTALFLSPLQAFSLEAETKEIVVGLYFHGDFYCIEYHKDEIACNGLLFNNIYLNPSISLTEEMYAYILQLLSSIQREVSENHLFSSSIVKTYIQLILALSSKQKSGCIEEPLHGGKCPNRHAMAFQKLLEQHFKKEKELSFYSEQLCIPTNTLSKAVKGDFGKCPSQLIHERVVLEAKKQLHLTYRLVKEIAFELGFEDEFYFSRYFKKSVGCSPKRYREQVGISVVAKMSI